MSWFGRGNTTYTPIDGQNEYGYTVHGPAHTTETVEMPHLKEQLNARQVLYNMKQAGMELTPEGQAEVHRICANPFADLDVEVIWKQYGVWE